MTYGYLRYGYQRVHALLITCLLYVTFALPFSAHAYVEYPQTQSLLVPYTHYSEREPLTTLLADFARSQGLAASFSAGVQGVVNGRFDQMEPSQFLAGMQSAYGVTYYRLGNTLYFYNEDETNRTFITPHAMSAGRLFTLLEGANVLAPELPAELLPTEEMIVVSGPAGSLEQIMRAVHAFESSQTSQFGMRVFPLKYAWAEDITVDSMDSTLTVPGVASILRAMITGRGTSATRVVQNSATVQSLGGTGLASVGSVTENTTEINTSSQTAANAQTGHSVNIMADPRVNAVLVQDALYRMPYYAEVIADLDKPVELVEIHAAIVDIDASYQRDLGVNLLGSLDVGGGLSVGGSSVSTTASETLTSSSGLLDGLASGGGSLSTIYREGADYFLARVEALEQNGEARMLGRPSVLTVDNVQASLENTSTYYIQVAGTETVDLFKVEAGTILRVTPHIIHEEGKPVAIKLAVTVQDEQGDDSDTTTTNSGLPPIKQTKINTQAVVGAGQSLLIGGYYYEQQVEGEEGVPGLKDIPLLGYLFKTKTKYTKRMERLILITPRVISIDELPEMPSHIDESKFHRSPTQDNYEAREPTMPEAEGGCSRSQEPKPETYTQHSLYMQNRQHTYSFMLHEAVPYGAFSHNSLIIAASSEVRP